MRRTRLVPIGLPALIGLAAWADTAHATGGKSFGEIYCADRPHRPCRTWGSWNTLTRDQLIARCKRGNQLFRVRNGCKHIY